MNNGKRVLWGFARDKTNARAEGGTRLNVNRRNMNMNMNMNSCARLAAVHLGQRQAALSAEGLGMNSRAPLFARCNHISTGART